VPLIRAAGEGDRPVVVGRGQSATIEEWLMAAERVLREGNRQVALCEQGIRTFETAVPAVLDFNAIALAHRLSHLPVVVNPSLAAGEAEIVPDLALAAAALKADAIVLDARAGASDDPAAGRQALPMGQLAGLIEGLKRTRAAVGA
jgi:3-deoxy-7-phosphoheptulonate synthase